MYYMKNCTIARLRKILCDRYYTSIWTLISYQYIARKPTSAVKPGESFYSLKTLLKNMTKLGHDKSLFWPNWVTINTQRSLNRPQRPNSVIGCPNSVAPYNQINQVGLHNYLYRYIDIYLHPCDIGIYVKIKVAISKNIRQITWIRMLISANGRQVGQQNKNYRCVSRVLGHLRAHIG